MSDTIQLYDAHGRRLYLSAAERDAFLDAATHADRPIRTLCSVLYYTGCRISEALALSPRRIDLHDQTIIFESLKKRRRGVYRAVPVPPSLLDTLDMVHGLREAHKRHHKGEQGDAGGLGGQWHLLHLKIHVRIPPLKNGAELPVQRPHARL
jgi:integrase